MTFPDALDRSIRLNRRPLVSTVVVALVVGFFLEASGATPGATAAAGVYLGTLVTLVLCSRVLARGHEGPAAPEGAPAWRDYLDDFVLIVSLAWVARLLVAGSLAPYHAGDPAWVFVEPITVGFPLDLLMVPMALTLTAVLGRGGMALTVVLVFATALLGEQAVVAPDELGAAAPLLEVVRFPWLELRALPADAAAGAWTPLLFDLLRVFLYGAAWMSVGMGLTILRSRSGTKQDADAGGSPEVSQS